MPTWRRDGKELDYIDPAGMLTAAELTESNGALQIAHAHTLFNIHIGSINDTYDTFPDGKKFLVDNTTTEESPAPLDLVQKLASRSEEVNSPGPSSANRC